MQRPIPPETYVATRGGIPEDATPFERRIIEILNRIMLGFAIALAAPILLIASPVLLVFWAIGCHVPDEAFGAAKLARHKRERPNYRHKFVSPSPPPKRT